MIRKELIIMADKDFETKEEVIHYLTHIDNKKVVDKHGFEKDVLEREASFVTYIGYEIGIPHARTAYVTEPFVVYLRLKKPVHWGRDDKENVNHLFLLGVPQNNKEDYSNANLHLRILVALSKNLMHDDFRERLFQAKNQDEIYDLLEKVKEEI